VRRGRADRCPAAGRGGEASPGATADGWASRWGGGRRSGWAWAPYLDDPDGADGESETRGERESALF